MRKKNLEPLLEESLPTLSEPPPAAQPLATKILVAEDKVPALCRAPWLLAQCWGWGEGGDRAATGEPGLS